MTIYETTFSNNSVVFGIVITSNINIKPTKMSKFKFFS